MTNLLRKEGNHPNSFGIHQYIKGDDIKSIPILRKVGNYPIYNSPLYIKRVRKHKQKSTASLKNELQRWSFDESYPNR